MGTPEQAEREIKEVEWWERSFGLLGGVHFVELKVV